MKLYHVTLKNYNIDQTVTIETQSKYARKANSRGLGWVNNYLDKYAPTLSPKRNQSIFSFETLDYCYMFGSSKYNNQHKNLKYYEIETLNSFKAPMALVDHILKLGSDYPKLQEIANEYWNHCLRWNVFEYLSESIKITQKMTTIVTRNTVPVLGYGEFQGCKYKYIADNDLCNKKWKVKIEN